MPNETTSAASGDQASAAGATLTDHSPVQELATSRPATSETAPREAEAVRIEPAPPARGRRKWYLAAAALALVAVGFWLAPSIRTALTTISTDDAYVNGHVTFLAPRVAGQVTQVLVDDNYRVKKGDVLVRLDREPYQVQVAIKRAAVVAAKADLVAANAKVRGQVATARANRFLLAHAIEDVNTQIANLSAAVATLESKKANLELARANLRRGEALAPSGGISKEDLDIRRQTVKVDEA